MKQLKGACVYGQSGGPTAVINSSACGVIETALKNDNITNVYAANHGIQGILNDELFDCSKELASDIKLLRGTPASAFGSCRYMLDDSAVNDSDYKRIIEIFKKYDIRYFFYNGGNDSMDTCAKVSAYCEKVGYECNVIGIPKTIDNDLVMTDHCPGYGSAAKYIATSISEVSLDNDVYAKGSIIIFEIMGRHAGWLTAASALANVIGEGPDLIYLPEAPFDIDNFVADVDDVFSKKGKCIVAVSEGVKDVNGKFISEYGAVSSTQKDAFGHTQLGGLASTLVALVKDKTKAKCRGIEFSLLQRCASHCASAADVNEAYLAGSKAVEYACAGHTASMMAFERAAEGNYKCSVAAVPLSQVANGEKTVPAEWINRQGNNVTQEFIDYALPLIQGEPERATTNGLPKFAQLKKVVVKK